MGELGKLDNLAAKSKFGDDSSRVYLDALNQALRDKEAQNIAINGGYGAGKSTVINTYFVEHENDREKMMQISIAKFEPKEKAETPEKEPVIEEENVLEQQILQQMFFQVLPKNIPHSRFTKLSDFPKHYIFGVILYFVITVLFAIHFVNGGANVSQQFITEQLSNLDNSNQLMGSILIIIKNKIQIIYILLFIILISTSLYMTFFILKKLGISRFGFANTSIEIHSNDGTTVFNHYLDEIIYLFKKTKFEYIIFEDLDRFRSLEIFERLRSLNTLLNRSAQLKHKKIKFIYALKDDVFNHDDSETKTFNETNEIHNRTKFFDMIIPVVKYMHSSNAESVIKDRLKEFTPLNKNTHHHQLIDMTLIEDLSLFINDMRTAINICNEFKIIRLRLEDSSIIYNQLFAFVVYKNMYPKDYSDLLQNEGMVYKIFKEKDKLARLNREIDEVQLLNKSISRLLMDDGIRLDVDLSEHRLLYFLIYHNWLNEDYEGYLTPFREGVLNTKENEFLKEVKLGSEAIDVNFKLENVGKINERIRLGEINSNVIINGHFIAYLLKHENMANNKEKLIKVIAIIFQNKDDKLPILLLLIHSLEKEDPNTDLVWKFFHHAIENDIDIWKHALDDNPSEEVKEDYAVKIMQHIGGKGLDIWGRNHLIDFISGELNVGKLINHDNIFKFVEENEIAFASLKAINSDEILDEIISLNAYSINIENISRIFQDKWITIELLQEKNQVYEYCLNDENVGTFIEKVLLEQKQYNEGEEIFVQQLNRLIKKGNLISHSLFESLIEKWHGSLTDLSQIKSFKLAKIFYQHRKFEYSWENIYHYMGEFRLQKTPFDIKHLLFNEDAWDLFLAYCSEDIQEKFVDDDVYSDFVNEILYLKLDEHPKIEQFIQCQTHYVRLEEKDAWDELVLESLIDHHGMTWEVYLYHDIESIAHKIKYVQQWFNEEDQTVEDVQALISGNKLIWSRLLFEMFVESAELDEHFMKDYIEGSMDDIKEASDGHLIDKLTAYFVESSVYVSYLEILWKNGFKEEVMREIHGQGVPWDPSLFDHIRENEIEIAARYQIQHLNHLDQIKMDQALFDAMVMKLDNAKDLANFIEDYHDEIEIEENAANVLYDFFEEEEEVILEILDEQAMIKLINQLSLEKSAKLLHKYIVSQEVNRDWIFKFLTKLKKPYNSFKLKRGKEKIPSVDTRVKNLIMYLDKRDVISSYRIIKNEMIVWRKEV